VSAIDGLFLAVQGFLEAPVADQSKFICCTGAGIEADLAQAVPLVFSEGYRLFSCVGGEVHRLKQASEVRMQELKLFCGVVLPAFVNYTILSVTVHMEQGKWQGGGASCCTRPSGTAAVLEGHQPLPHPVRILQGVT